MLLSMPCLLSMVSLLARCDVGSAATQWYYVCSLPQADQKKNLDGRQLFPLDFMYVSPVQKNNNNSLAQCHTRVMARDVEFGFAC